MKKSMVVVAALSAALQFPAFGDLGGPALETDHPFYPGIGRCRDAQAILKAAYEEHARVCGGVPESDRDRSIAIWRWLMQHLQHGTSRPIEFLNNVTDPNEEASGVYDSVKFVNCYQFAICYASSCAIAGLMESAGFPARGRGVSGHTVHECFYDGGWHYLDHDMAGTCFKADRRTVASVDDLLADRSLLDWDYRGTYKIPQFPWDGGPGSKTMKGAFSLNKSVIYNDHGIAVHPSTLTLRHGERFTRYFNYDRAPWGRRFHWTGLKANPQRPHGEFRDCTFVCDPPADGRNDGRPAQPYVDDRVARYGNGLFEYEPDLSGPAFLREAFESANVAAGSGSPRLRADKGEGKVVLRQWTPYVICGAPETHDPWGKVADAVVVSGTAAGQGVKVAVSANGGLNWEERPVSGDFSEDFSMLCRARYQYLLRFTFPPGEGLNRLHVRTVTMCGVSMLPHLHDGSNKVKYTATRQGVVFADPDLSSAEGFQGSFDEVSGFKYTGADAFTRAVPATPAGSWLTMKLRAPGAVRRVGVYAFLGTSSPARANCNVEFLYSTDGKDYKSIRRKTLATDNDHWRHWLGGLAEVPGGGDHVFLRLRVEPNGTPMRLCRIGGYAWYDTGVCPAMSITHAWKEGGAVRQHVEKVDAGASEKAYKVDCGSGVQNVSVAFEVPAKPGRPGEMKR